MNRSAILSPVHPELLRLLLDARIQMEPPARKAAVIASFVQVARLIPGKIGRDSLVLGMRVAATARDGDTPPVTARRATCAAVAEALKWRPGEMQQAFDDISLCADTPGINGGGLEDAAKWFQAQIDAWAGSQDPRLAAMAATAARELAEVTDPLPLPV